MASLFPNALDSFPDPAPNSKLNNPSHSGLHNDVSSAVEALEEKVGVNNSADPISLDYRVTALENAGGGGFNVGMPGPADMPNPAVAWNYDPLLISNYTSNILTAGTLYLAGVYLPAPVVISSSHVWTYKAGTSSSTGAFMGIWEHASGGALLAQTAEMDGATFNPLGFKTFTFTEPYSADAGWYYVGIWCYGGSGPDLLGRRGPVGLLTYTQVFMSAGRRRFATADTDLTTTFPATLGTQTQYLDAWWVGLS